MRFYFDINLFYFRTVINSRHLELNERKADLLLKNIMIESNLTLYIQRLELK